MVFTAEVFAPAAASCNDTSGLVETALETALHTPLLRDLEIVIRYVPVLRNDVGPARYPARSRLDRKNHACNCCPQLVIEPLLTGTPKARITEYIGGMRECGPALAKLGATQEQVACLTRALDETLAALARA